LYVNLHAIESQLLSVSLPIPRLRAVNREDARVHRHAIDAR